MGIRKLPSLDGLAKNYQEGCNLAICYLAIQVGRFFGGRRNFPCLSGWAIILLSGVGRNARQEVGQQFAVWIHAEVRSLAPPVPALISNKPCVVAQPDKQGIFWGLGLHPLTAAIRVSPLPSPRRRSARARCRQRVGSEDSPFRLPQCGIGTGRFATCNDGCWRVTTCSIQLEQDREQHWRVYWPCATVSNQASRGLGWKPPSSTA